MTQPIARRTPHRFVADPRRVIAKPYLPGEEIIPGGDSRAGSLMHRILDLPEAVVVEQLAFVQREFSHRHRGFTALLERHFELVAHHLPPAAGPLSNDRRLLIGAFYTHEYSLEGAALMNPSLVFAPDQEGTNPGERRVIMSARAVGEGHISSIEFRTGVLAQDGGLRFDPPGKWLVTGDRTAPSRYDKRQFALKLNELQAGNEVAWAILERLSARFTLAELEHSLAELESHGPPHAISFETIKIIRQLAASNYQTTFPLESTLSERVLFPAGPHESHGMEDARFVHFTDDDGSARYYATYTAYDGFGILPQMIETADFRSFTISTLNGTAAQNKGMALFPRRIAGKLVMLSRRDRENLHLSTSDDVSVWNDLVEIDRPRAAWQLMQIGNCGSPLETREGWLVLTHGVGAMRRYAIGALLLDLDDPRRVVGRLPFPLLEPDQSEREGYVPNVVYSCGGLLNGDRHLILPYGLSDGAIGIATVDLPELLAAIPRD
jgi:predicted GH43/DUF377 family glycosyl hydrolase